MLTDIDLQRIQLLLQPVVNQINLRFDAIEYRLDKVEARLDILEVNQHYHTRLILQNQTAIQELQERIKYLPTKDEYLTHADQVYGELRTLRENHEHRLTKLESNQIN